MKTETNQKIIDHEFYLKTVDEKLEKSFKAISLIALTLPIALLFLLLIDTFIDGMPRFSWSFLTSFPSRFPEKAGILSALVGSLYLIGLTALISVPVSIGAAIYLEEYAPKNWFTNLIEINISNLAGIPSVIYGLLGLGLLVRVMGLGRSLLAGAITLSFMLLPVIIITTREALRIVPQGIKEAGYALGGEKWAVIFKLILPLSLPGILTGIILALARAIGETAPLITIGALTYIAFLPDSIHSPFTALPIQIFNWISRPQAGFHINAAAGIIVLLVILLLMNSVAVILRNKMQRRITW